MTTQVNIKNAAGSKRCKAILESKLTELLGFSRDREELRINYLADPIDRVQSKVDRDISVQRLDDQTRLLHEVQCAIAKIEGSTYGTCERCEAQIPRNRLKAIPWARFCVACQSKAESAELGGTTRLEHAA